MSDLNLDKFTLDVVKRLEDESGAKAYTLTKSTGKSGVSIGAFQGDFAKNDQAQMP